eukprot:scaffold229187_cov32-Attheya_sp.AAC.1
MAASPPEACDDLRGADLLLALQETATGVNLSQAWARNNTGETWETFCIALRSSPGDTGMDSSLAVVSRSALAQSVEEAIHAIGHTCTFLGAQNPRLNVFGHLDEHLSAQQLGAGPSTSVATHQGDFIPCD